MEKPPYQCNTHMSTIAYLGKPWSFSYIAAYSAFGTNNTYRGCVSFTEIFKHVQEGSADIGVVPVENTLAGSIQETLDLLETYTVRITGEQYLRVEHFLLARPSNVHGTERIKEMHTVYSHPKALAQCKHFLERYPWIRQIECEDTATAAYMVSKAEDTSIAAIASKEAGQWHNLQVVRGNIEDTLQNYTRFIHMVKIL